LAKLKSRKDEATPITREERHGRQERARQLMSKNALDAIVLMEGTSLRYFTGIRWWGGERTFALVLPTKGAAFYVCPAFEEGRAREQIANAPDGEQPDVRVWQEDESPYQRIAQGLQERGIPSNHRERHSRDRRLPHDQECSRNRIDATGGASDACGLRGGISGGQRRDDATATGGSGAESSRTVGLYRRRRCASGRIFGVSPRLGNAAGCTRRHHRSHGWRMRG